MSSLSDFPLLDQIYIDLFNAIARQRPLITKEYEELKRLAEEFNHDDFEKKVMEGLEQIRGTFHMVDRMLEASKKEESAISSLLILEAHQLIYTHANIWHVVIDGVIFESVYEVSGNELLDDVASTVGMGVLELLMDVVEPLSSYNYIEIDEDRVHRAHQLRQQFSPKLEKHLSERFERFLEFHSGVKRWQVEFQDHSRKYFQVYIPKVREMCIICSRELGFNLSEKISALGICSILFPMNLFQICVSLYPQNPDWRLTSGHNPEMAICSLLLPGVGASHIGSL